MTYQIRSTPMFDRQFKALYKKYPSLKSDVARLFAEIQNNPKIGPRWLLYGEGEMLRGGIAKDGGDTDARTIEALHSDLEEFRQQAAAAREERRFFMQQITELKKTAARPASDASCAAAG